MANHKAREDELASNIDKTRKQVTILFTDIVDSSRYWDQFGDIKGRMMVDRHNRLVFPMIKRCHGRVLKTIGDGLMACFKNADDALNAAIGIQQILKKMREADRSFHAKVRIGLHTGMAIVEQNDIYGDAVNVANRVESFGEANEIILSQSVVDSIRDKKHAFHKKGSFIPKGKREPTTVYRCRWNEYKDLTSRLKFSSDLPLDPREKGDIIAYGLLGLVVLLGLYLIYIRYLLIATGVASNSLSSQLLILNPLLIFSEFPPAASILIIGMLVSILLLINIKNAPYVFMRILKGCTGFGLGFFLIYVPVQYVGIGVATAPGQEIYKSQQRFMLVNQQNKASLALLPIDQKNLHSLFERALVVPIMPPLSQYELQRNARHVGLDAPAMLEDEQVLATWGQRNLSFWQPKHYYFRLLDLCALCLGVLGFLSGFMNFNIRPS